MKGAVVRSTVTIVVALLAVGAGAGCQSTKGQSTGEYLTDSKITATVKTKLSTARPRNLLAVGVDTNNGVVYLTGTVETPEDRDMAEMLAKDASGVKQVVNNIEVQRK